MMKRLTLTLLAVTLFWVYRTAFLYAVGHATAIHWPAWWLRLVPRDAHGVFLWTFLCHTVAVVLVTLPIAWVLARVYGRLSVYLGAAGALVLLIPDVISTMKGSQLMSTFAVTVTTVDFIKIAVALPLAAWLFLRLPSNSRLSGP